MRPESFQPGSDEHILWVLREQTTVNLSPHPGAMKRIVARVRRRLQLLQRYGYDLSDHTIELATRPGFIPSPTAKKRRPSRARVAEQTVEERQEE